MAQVLQPVLRTSVAPVWFPLAPVPPLATTSSKRGPATLASITALAVHVGRKGRRAEVSRPSSLSATSDDSEVMKSLPSFISVPPDVLPVIRTFAEQHRNDTVVTWITGKRVQVYLSGEKSRPFLDYAKKHRHLTVLSFLEELKTSLASLAAQQDGEASEDIAALVGAAEMQVPHTDLLPGQVQVILALTETSSTLVYDPKLPQPSRKEVAKIMGIAVKELAEDGQFGLVYQSFPLVLPVKDVYQNMVESYTAGPFRCGDAVQIKDGIVHAGPGCEDEAVDERVVIFMTYRTFRDEHYEFTFQAKLWDWASHPAIPPMVAYRRLQEVYSFGLQNGMDIKPWTYYPPVSLEACKMLCTTPGLDEMTVELLVEEWREMLYDENIKIVTKDQEKSELLGA